MRIARLRLTLPARMKATAAGDARLIAETVARALEAAPGQAGSIGISLDSHGRPARALAFDLTAAAGRATRAPHRVR